MNKYPSHAERIVALKRIEGQVRGLQNMIEDRRYCVDIITQLYSIIGALYGVGNQIFKRHIESCVVNALKGRSESEKQKKINEVIELISKFRKAA